MNDSLFQEKPSWDNSSVQELFPRPDHQRNSTSGDTGEGGKNSWWRKGRNGGREEGRRDNVDVYEVDLDILDINVVVIIFSLHTKLYPFVVTLMTEGICLIDLRTLWKLSVGLERASLVGGIL